jgi:hypothetical protein
MLVQGVIRMWAGGMVGALIISPFVVMVTDKEFTDGIH